MKRLLLLYIAFGLTALPFLGLGQVPLQTFGIDFSNGSGSSPQNWNRISSFSVGGTIGDLQNLQQQTSGYAMEVTDNFNGAWVSGLSTGDDSGPVPDAVMATFWYNQYDQGILKFTLDSTKKYTFRFYGGRDGNNDDKSSDYTIGDTTATLYNWNNLYNSVEIDNVVPNANGEVFVSVKASAGYAYAILNGIIIEEYTDSPPPATALYRINTGGPAYGGWTADQYGSGGNTYFNSTAIAGTENDQLYQSERYGEDFTYQIPVDTAAPLIVKLHFAEIYYGVVNTEGIGARVFNVDIENGQGLLTGYDIMEKAGAPATAIVETFNGINVIDGNLTIVFTKVMDKDAKVSGIEVLLSDSENTPPVLAQTGDLSLEERDTMNVSISATDPDGDSLSLTAAGLPPFISFTDNGDGTGTLSLSPGTEDSGSYHITLIATDEGGLSDGKEIAIAVNDGTLNALARINSGGTAFTFNGREDWLADQYVNEGKTDIENVPIAGATNDGLYQANRYGETFIYNIPVNGTDSFIVKLHFAEIYHGVKNSLGVGARIFNVDVENGQGLLSNYDIIERADVPATAIVETFSDIQVDDGFLTIAFTTVTDNAMVSGIEILTTGEVNLPPVLAHIGNLDLIEGGTLNVDVTSSDPDGHIPQLTASGLPPFTGFIDNGDGTGSLTFSPGAGESGRYQITVTATDQGGLSDENIITVFVSNGMETVLTRLNGGGGAYVFGEENWGADQYADSGSVNTETVAIAGTENDQLYQTERYGSNFTYNIPVSATVPLIVELHFAEVYFGVDDPNGIGARVFNVDIEGGQGQLNNYDIIERAGAPATAIVESFGGINVADGNLTIAFTTIKNYAKISGIEVLSSTIGVPGQLKADSWTKTSVSLSWQDNAAHETGYLVERSGTPGSGFAVLDSLPEGTERFTDSGLQPGLTYYYRVKALGQGGAASGYSGEARVRTAEDLAGNTDLVQDPRYNGFISAVKWKNYGSGDEKIYAYHYDDASRLKAAQYAEGETVSDVWTTTAALGGFSVHGLGYDANGNITGLNRQFYDGTVKTMDALSYAYQGNRLLSVTDRAGSKGFADGNLEGDDYAYDANGNLTKDLNRGITLISYNHLDLPERVDFVDGTCIVYVYDAAGTKLAEERYDARGNLVNEKDYMGAFVYENDTLQFIHHEEGRIVPGLVAGSYEYQYHLRDHLGNTRLTVGTAPDEYVFTATFETENAADEEAMFTTIGETRVPSVAADANDDGGDEVIRLNGGQPMGAGLALPVSPGDTVSMSVWGYYEGGDDYNTQQGLNAFIAAIAGGFGGINGGTEAQQATYDAFDYALNDVGLLGTGSNSVPAAYLNYILFDENMVYYQHGYAQVDQGANMNHDSLVIKDIVVSKPGFVYVYLSNESASQNWVYFDDMEVTLKQFGVEQAEDYYPYGLTFNSYYKVNAEKNGYLYQGKELLAGTNLYDFHARRYSPALGRFLSLDSRGQFASGFTGMGNNPVMFVDPDGELAWFVPLIIGAVINVTSQAVAGNIDNFWQGLGYAAVGAASAYVGAGVGTAAAGLGAVGSAAAAGAAGGAISGGFNSALSGGDFGRGLWTGALGGAVGGALNGLVPTYGILPGAAVGAGSGGLVSGGLSAAFGGDFWQGFGSGAIAGGIIGGIYGGIAASQSQYDRSILFGTLTRSGGEQAFLAYAKQYNLRASGAKNILFENLDDAYGVTRPLDPNTGKPISLVKAARSYPQGVDSEVAFGSNRLMSLKKIEANVLHERQHVIDLRAGKATQFLNASKTTMGFRGRFEISAHRAVYNLGIQRAYNMSRIRYWQQFR